MDNQEIGSQERLQELTNLINGASEKRYKMIKPVVTNVTRFVCTTACVARRINIKG